MAKRYLGGGVSFEQKDVYQEFSEDEGGGGSATLSGLTDVDISNPTNGQVLVYNAESGKWENGSGGALIVSVRGEFLENCTLTTKWSDIDAALSNGTPCYVHCIEETEQYRNAMLFPLTLAGVEDGEYFVSGPTGYQTASFSTNSPDGYPAFGGGGDGGE